MSPFQYFPTLFVTKWLPYSFLFSQFVYVRSYSLIWCSSLFSIFRRALILEWRDRAPCASTKAQPITVSSTTHEVWWQLVSTQNMEAGSKSRKSFYCKRPFASVIICFYLLLLFLVKPLKFTSGVSNSQFQNKNC